MITLSPEDFISRFPEFRPAYQREPGLVAQALETAQVLVDQQVFLSAYRSAVYLRAGHELAMSPFGENLRTKDGSSLYMDRFLQLSNSRRPRVMLGGGGVGNGW